MLLCARLVDDLGDSSPSTHTITCGGECPKEDGHRGCGGAGGLGGGRRGGRVGFGRGGAGAVFRRNQPSRFWRELRPLIESPHPLSSAQSAVVRPRAFAVQRSSYLQ